MKLIDRALGPPAVPPRVRRPRPQAAAHALDFGYRCQEWLRAHHSLSFGPALDRQDATVACDGACLAWRHRSDSWAAWAYAGACVGALACLVGGIAARVWSPQGAGVWGAVFAGLASTAVGLFVIAASSRRRAREEIAVAWDQGPRPLSPEQRRQIAASLRKKWPRAVECWLITRRPLDAGDDDSGLRVFLVTESDLPRTSAPSRTP